jgi:hypothetical protein
MGKRADNNFKKRFGDPPRIVVKFEQKPLDSEERKYRSRRIADAVKAILTDLLGREPTHDELIGRVPIAENDIKKVKRD